MITFIGSLFNRLHHNWRILQVDGLRLAFKMLLAQFSEMATNLGDGMTGPVDESSIQFTCSSQSCGANITERWRNKGVHHNYDFWLLQPRWAYTVPTLGPICRLTVQQNGKIKMDPLSWSTQDFSSIDIMTLKNYDRWRHLKTIIDTSLLKLKKINWRLNRQ